MGDWGRGERRGRGRGEKGGGGRGEENGGGEGFEEGRGGFVGESEEGILEGREGGDGSGLELNQLTFCFSFPNNPYFVLLFSFWIVFSLKKATKGVRDFV